MSMGGMNLGGAQFTVTANTAQFQQGMQQVQQQAAQAGHAVGAAFNRNAAMGILEVSRAVEDLQYGFAAVVNNIPGIVTGLGFGMGVAGVASLAAVAINQLYQHWDDIASLWREGETDNEAERVKRLADATEALKKAGEGFTVANAPAEAMEQRVRNTERARKTADTLLNVLPPEQRESGKNVRRAVEAFGSQAVLKELQEALVRAKGDFGKEANEAHAKNLFTNLLQGRRDAIELMREIGRDTKIGAVLGGGETPDETRRREAAQAAEAKHRDEQRKAEQRRKDNEQIEMLNKEGREADREQKAIARKAELEQRFALEGKVDAARQKMHAAQMDTSKPFRGDYFEYATSHGEAYEQKQQLQKLEAIRKEQENAVAELKKFNEKQQIARAG